MHPINPHRHWHSRLTAPGTHRFVSGDEVGYDDRLTYTVTVRTIAADGAVSSQQVASMNIGVDDVGGV